MKPFRLKTVLASVALTALILFPIWVWAENSSSTNFLVREAFIGAIGGNATSANFQGFGAGLFIEARRTSSTNFTAQGGPLSNGFSPASQNWRFYDDETNETPLIPLAAENVAPVDILNQDILKLRFTIKETAGVNGMNVKYKLQFSRFSNFSEALDVAEIGDCTADSQWCFADGGGTDNALISTALLTDSGNCTGSAGSGCGTHNESSISTSTLTHASGTAKEFEFTLKQSDAEPNTTYFFRAYDPATESGVPPNYGETYPSLTVYGTTLSFSISGLPNGTTTEGIVTDATSTATAIAFGTLGFGTETIAAQRLTVSTNAAEGYRIFTFADQDLTNESGFTIPPLLSTNASPAGWDSGCAATSTGCYGYHAGEDVLSGGSTRFAPNDSFAKFTSSSAEVAYNSGPAADRATDIIFKIEARTNQDAGNYESSVNYIIVPVF